MPRITKLSSLTCLLYAVLAFISCQPDAPIVPPVIPGLATVTTAPAMLQTNTNLVSGGNISSNGGDSVTERGICYHTAANPTIANSKVVSGSGNGSFIATINNLLPNTLYYIRAYAINNSGTAYGTQVTVQTTIVQTAPVDSAKLLFIGGNNNFYCFNAQNGQLKWSKPYSSQVSAAACYSNGTVFMACEDAHLYAYDTLGNLKWNVVYTSSNPAYFSYRTTPSVINNTVFITDGRYLSAFDAITGTLKWRYDAWTPALYSNIMASCSVEGNTVYLNSNGYLTALDPVNGAVKWSYFRVSMKVRPKIYHNKAYVLDEGLSNQELRVLNATTGTVLWTKVLGYSSEDAISLNVVDNNIYLYKGGLIVLDTLNGSAKWTAGGYNNNYSFQGGSSPVVANGFVHVVVDGNTNGKVFVYNANTGVQAGSYGNNIHEADVTVVNGYSYFGTRDILNTYNGYLYAVKMQPDGTASTAWTSIIKSDFRGVPCIVTASGNMFRAGGSN